MDPTTITLIIGVVILVIDKIYDWMNKIYKSKCCGCDVDRKTNDEDKKLLYNIE